MQLNPARGGKLIKIDGEPNHAHRHGLCSSTPRGDGNTRIVCARPSYPSGFMQLNPARGRKRRMAPTTPQNAFGLCSSTPRGDGNYTNEQRRWAYEVLRFMQLNPARGRKLASLVASTLVSIVSVYAAQPREGTETWHNAIGLQSVAIPVWAA